MKILYINKNTNLSTPIVKNLKEMGMEVDVLIEELPDPINKNKIEHKIKNILYRTIKKDKNYFLKLEKIKFQKFAEKRLKNKEYDIAFFIRADMYSEKLIRKIRKQSKKMINYQWDGLDYYPKIFDYFKYFDRMLVFNSYDIKKYPQYNLIPLPIFHYGEISKDEKLPAKYDFYYLGVGLNERIELAKNIEQFATDNGLSAKLILTVPEFKKEQKTAYLSLQHDVVSLQENEIYMNESNVVVDFKAGNHNGVAFRYFECMRREQKLITNNTHIKDYEFYHPNNIFLCDFKDFSGVMDFLNKPYHKLDSQMVAKYSIKNWLKYALDIPPYSTLDLPKI